MKMMWLIAFNEPERLNVAVTAVPWPTVTLHGPMPEHAPDQPANWEFAPALAESVTFVPAPNFALQVCPQLIPAGLLVTVPVPGPVSETESPVGAAKVAPTLTSELNVTVNAPVPEQAADQPEKELFGPGVAVSVTEVPASKAALQVCPQSIPAGALVTVPEPLELTLKVN